MAFYGGYGFRPYVPVRARRAQAARELAQLRKKGRTVSPVTIDGRKIARTFWGEAWCDNLERYSDFANRLPRGRTYVRNGSVVDLQVEPGRVTALVSGSSMYTVQVTVGSVPGACWGAIRKDCAGAIDSLVELLQGRLSSGVMARLCEEKAGLFPAPKDIAFTCSCPDWASMCKHVAAVLYGIGARLDAQPELLFTLRQVDQQDLIATAGATASMSSTRPASGRVLATDDLSEMFGIEVAPEKPAKRASTGTLPRKRSTSGVTLRASKKSTMVPSSSAASKRAVTKKAVTKKPAAQKPAPKKAAPKRAAPKKAVAKKAVAGRSNQSRSACATRKPESDTAC